MYWPVLQRSSGLMRRLVMDNNEKVSSRAKPQTIEVRKLQHDLVASLSGGKFCKLQWILHIQYTTNHRPQLAMATPNNRKKTRFCSITQFLEPIRLGCVILVWCLCVASCELKDLFDTQAHTHTQMGWVNTSVKGTTFDPNRCHSHVTSADAWIVADHVLLTQSWGFR